MLDMIRRGCYALALTTAACTSTQAPNEGVQAADEPLAGWYTQLPDRARFQPCGDRESLVVIGDAELRKRAAAFGLEDGLPIYVRMRGVRTAGEFHPAGVEQFGSPTPIRDCPMTGTTIQQ
jgi:hypothetical protein